MAVCEVVCEVCFRMFRRESDRKDTSVWQRGHTLCCSLSVNSMGQPSARSVNLGLGAEVGWQSIDADQEASAAERYLVMSLLPYRRA